ncbi:MAG TPA: Crp/Fnr family transcriptional regulator [Pyrinomonadaceae bacterium]|jgi:CRP-like cAMP-binding protein
MKMGNLPGRRSQIRKNANIWEPEDFADKLYFAEAGRIRIVRLNGDGSETLLEIVEAREFFGEACLLKGGRAPRKTMAKALGDCSIVEFSARRFLELIKNDAFFFERFITSVAARKLRAERRVAALGSRRIEHRLGNVLLDLAAEKEIGTRDAASSKIKVFVTHEELADLTAASRQRVTKTMNDFRKMKLVDYGRTKPLTIDVPALEDYLEKSA